MPAKLKPAMSRRIVALSIGGFGAPEIRLKLANRVSLAMIYEVIATARAQGLPVATGERRGSVPAAQVGSYKINIASAAICNGLLAAAKARGLPPVKLVEQIICTVVVDNLIDAVLDDA